MKTAFWDIETSNLQANFAVLLSCGIKPQGRPPIMLYGGRKGKDDSLLCRRVKAELEQYDILVSHYGLNFDLPFLNTRLLRWNMPKLQRCIHIDTYRIAKGQARLSLHSRRLETIAEFLGIPGKTRIKPEVWVDAALGRGKDAQDALAQIVEHNRWDVIVLEKVFERLKQFINRLERA